MPFGFPSIPNNDCLKPHEEPGPVDQSGCQAEHTHAPTHAHTHARTHARTHTRTPAHTHTTTHTGHSTHKTNKTHQKTNDPSNSSMALAECSRVVLFVIGRWSSLRK